MATNVCHKHYKDTTVEGKVRLVKSLKGKFNIIHVQLYNVKINEGSTSTIMELAERRDILMFIQQTGKLPENFGEVIL